MEWAVFRAYANLDEGQGALACGGTPSTIYSSSLSRLAQGQRWALRYTPGPGDFRRVMSRNP